MPIFESQGKEISSSLDTYVVIYVQLRHEISGLLKKLPLIIKTAWIEKLRNDENTGSKSLSLEVSLSKDFWHRKSDVHATVGFRGENSERSSQSEQLEMQRINHNTPLCFCAYVNSVCQICRISVVVSSTNHFLHIRPEQDSLARLILILVERKRS